MKEEECLTEHNKKIVEHLLSLNAYLDMDKNYETILKYTVLSMKRVDCAKTKMRDKNSIYSLSSWATELVRLALTVGREVNRMRRKQGMQPLDFTKEATQKELTDAKDNAASTPKDTGTVKG